MKPFIVTLLLLAVTACRSQQIDTIKFKDGTYVVKVGDSLVINDMAKAVAFKWRNDVTARSGIGRGLYHSWQALIGLRREFLLQLIGKPDFMLPDRYIYETDFATDGFYWGCWLNVDYAAGKISYIGVGCPN